MKFVAMFIVLVIGVGALIAVDNYFPPAPFADQSNGEIKTFNSMEDLRSYVKESAAGSEYYYAFGGARAQALIGDVAIEIAVQSDAAPSVSGSEKSSDYSTTNVQVAGVDEADYVKNDDKYIYMIVQPNYAMWNSYISPTSRIVIVDAFPPESGKVVSEINFNESVFSPSQLFLNGDRLVVIGSEIDYSYFAYGTGVSEGSVYVAIPIEIESQETLVIDQESFSDESVAKESLVYPSPIAYSPPKTVIKIYDISDRTNPQLVREESIDGSYTNARMIGDNIYLITNQYVYSYDDLAVPEVAYNCLPGEVKTVSPCFNVFYFDVPDVNNQFTIVSSIDVQGNEDAQSKVFLMSYTQNVYVSNDNIYLTYSKHLSPTDFLDRYVEVINPILPSDVKAEVDQIMSSEVFNNAEKMAAFQRVIQEYTSTLSGEARTNFQLDVNNRMEELQKEISKETEKTVIQKISIGGMNINHAATGEVPGYTLNQFSMDEYNGNFRIATTTGSWGSEQENHLFVLDSNLNRIGSVEDLATGERIYSVRFVGDRVYVVTFKQIDPLFVIDLQNPQSPNVLGFLKIPGVSDYLHPYDENHIIGVGREATEEGRITGVKVSLFDITNPANPVEVDKHVIESANTEASYDHHAFLFYKEKGILVIPVSLYYNDVLPMREGAEFKPQIPEQAAYVFDIDIDSLELKGTVTHIEESDDYSSYYRHTIARSLYMNDYLYTISQAVIKSNSLLDLSEVVSIDIDQ